MKLAIKTNALRAGLNLISKVIDKRTILPSLTGVKLSARKGMLYLHGSDLVTSVSIKLDADVSQHGKALVEAATLYSLIASTKSEDVELQCSKTEMFISSPKSKVKLRMFPLDEYPSRPVLEDLTIPIKRTVFTFALNAAIASNEVSYSESSRGCYIEVDKEQAFGVGMDSAWVLVCGKSGGDGLVIPKKEALFLAKNLSSDKLYVAIQDEYLFVIDGDATYAVKVLNAEPPPWQEIVVKNTNVVQEVDVECNLLLDALKYVRVVAINDSVSLTSKMNDLIVEANNAEQCIEILAQSNVYATASVNGKVLQEVVRALAQYQEFITIQWQKDLQPLLLQAEDFIGAIAQKVK